MNIILDRDSNLFLHNDGRSGRVYLARSMELPVIDCHRPGQALQVLRFAQFLMGLPTKKYIRLLSQFSARPSKPNQ